MSSYCQVCGSSVVHTICEANACLARVTPNSEVSECQDVIASLDRTYDARESVMYVYCKAKGKITIFGHQSNAPRKKRPKHHMPPTKTNFNTHSTAHTRLEFQVIYVAIAAVVLREKKQA